MTLMLALAAFLQPAPTAPVQTPGWRLFLGGSGSGSTIYVDLAGVRRLGDLADTPMHLVNDSPTAEGVKSMAMRVQIDCRNHTSILTEAYAYGANGAYLNGASYGTVGRAPRPAAPGSDDERLERLACAVRPARP